LVNGRWNGRKTDVAFLVDYWTLVDCFSTAIEILLLLSIKRLFALFFLLKTLVKSSYLCTDVETGRPSVKTDVVITRVYIYNSWSVLLCELFNCVLEQNFFIADDVCVGWRPNTGFYGGGVSGVLSAVSGEGTRSARETVAVEEEETRTRD
jgi:hypothetical protein